MAQTSRIVSFPRLRVVDAGAPFRWLRAGWFDLSRSSNPSLFYGTCFAATGWLLNAVFAHIYTLFAGLATGFLLVGPFLAMGFYELSRQLERGQSPRLLPTLSVWRSNLGNIAVFSAVLTIVLMIWARVSMVVFALFYEGSLPTFAGLVHAVFTFQQPKFALVYFAVGAFCAAFVFALSVISIPLMLDRDTDAVTAALASLVACTRNPKPMLIWAACIVALVALGFATFFLGLIIVMPLVGHATWHAYREIVDEPA